MQRLQKEPVQHSRMTLQPPDDQLWRRQLAKRGYAKCTNPSCRLCFLSLAGVVAHHRYCL